MHIAHKKMTRADWKPAVSIWQT